MSKSHGHSTGQLAPRPPLTPVGVDVGVRRLATAAAADSDPESALVVDGGPVREDYDRLASAVNALEFLPGDRPGEAAIFAAYYHRIAAKVNHAATRVTEYASEWPAPVLVLEDFPQSGCPLWALRDGEGDLGNWLMPTFQTALVERAVAAGIPVVDVDPDYTTRACHECRQLATVEGETIVCNIEDCPVGEVCRDRSAALSIARRASVG